VLSGCASTAPPVPTPVFDDADFAPSTQRILVADVMAVNEDMRSYIRTNIAPQIHMQSPQDALVESLLRKGHLKLEYDAGMTRTASQAFDARSGNCLSLVLMTAAFAKELGLQVTYQSAITDETWTRAGGLYFRSGHVNLSLGRRHIDLGDSRDYSQVTIDFLPPEDLRGLRTTPIEESTVLSMYMNNRAAETLLEGSLDDAYWWAREAVVLDPRFASAYNTLGVIYLRHGNLSQAEQTLRQVLIAEPSNTRAMANLAQVLERAGRTVEATELQHKLALLEPHPPYYFFDLGIAAMQRGDFEIARSMFEKEVARADYQHEFHFWLGLANYRLGRVDEARRQLQLALEHSSTQSERALYAAKLERLRTVR
jgi:Flp pilus assembly protein TadD